MFKRLPFLILFSIVIFFFTYCKESAEKSEKTLAVIAKNKIESVKEIRTVDTIKESPKLIKSLRAKVDSIESESKKKEIVTEKKEAKTPKKKKKRARMKFGQKTFDFGKIKEGDKIEHNFKFKNVGEVPLVIKNVEVSCGCTFPSYPFIPIKPGEEGVIGITFNSKHKIGRQKPTVTVITNARPRTHKLYLEGFVE